MKDPLRPEEQVEEDVEGIIYVIGYDKATRSVECVADEIEEGVINSMMPEYLMRRCQNSLEEKGHGSSRRRRSDNPVRYRWLFSDPPPSFTHMFDLLSRINFTSEWDKRAAKECLNTKYIDLSMFTSVEVALERCTICMSYIQKIMAAIPLKWGQSNSNLETIHELQLDNKLPYQHRYFRCDVLGTFLPNHPFYRTKLLSGTSNYCPDFFTEVRLEAIIIWPQDFLDGPIPAWKHVMGQLEMHCQMNWVDTRGEALSGMRDCTGNTRAQDVPPTDSRYQLSYIYSARYIDAKACENDKNQQRVSMEGKKKYSKYRQEGVMPAS
jgi:hypothetical protein